MELIYWTHKIGWNKQRFPYKRMELFKWSTLWNTRWFQKNIVSIFISRLNGIIMGNYNIENLYYYKNYAMTNSTLFKVVILCNWHPFILAESALITLSLCKSLQAILTEQKHMRVTIYPNNHNQLIQLKTRVGGRGKRRIQTSLTKDDDEDGVRDLFPTLSLAIGLLNPSTKPSITSWVHDQFK